METIGEIIHDLRKEKNITASELADAIGRHGENNKQYIYDVEKGRIKRLTIETIRKLAGKLEVPIHTFISIPGSQNGNNGENTFAISTRNTTNWEKKYLQVTEENSLLKSKIIRLLEAKKENKFLWPFENKARS